MHINSTDFKNLPIDTELYMVRYSQSPNPDFVIVKFKSYDKDGRGTLEFEAITSKTGRKQIKKTNKQKAMYRFFTDQNEMAKSLFDCFKKRNIVEIPKEYHQLIETSQDIRPEIWI
jgi:hypothetical protein